MLPSLCTCEEAVCIGSRGQGRVRTCIHGLIATGLDSSSLLLLCVIAQRREVRREVCPGSSSFQESSSKKIYTTRTPADAQIRPPCPANLDRCPDLCHCTRGTRLCGGSRCSTSGCRQGTAYRLRTSAGSAQHRRHLPPAVHSAVQKGWDGRWRRLVSSMLLGQAGRHLPAQLGVGQVKCVCVCDRGMLTMYLAFFSHSP